MIPVIDVKFGSAVTAPGPSQRTVTGFQHANGYDMALNETSGLLLVTDAKGHKKLYPITNIKEMTPFIEGLPLVVDKAEKPKRGRPAKAE